MAMAAEGTLSSGARDLFAGIFSGFVVKFVEYPFDTVKVLQQTMGDKYQGVGDCLRQTYTSGGLLGFYRGLLSPLVGSMAECATLFVAYGWMKKVLDVDESKATLASPVPMWKYYVSGAWSGCFSSFVLTPVELVKCRLQVQAATGPGIGGVQYKGPADVVTKIMREEGITGLWRGNMGCLAREIPGNMAWFGTYELAMRGVQVSMGHERKSDVPVAWSALAGSCAGVMYWGVPFPADTVKSKLQTDPRFFGMSFGEVFNTVLREEGPRGLYRGSAITCARAAPAHALLFFAYEVADRWLQKL